MKMTWKYDEMIEQLTKDVAEGRPRSQERLDTFVDGYNALQTLVEASTGFAERRQRNAELKVFVTDCCLFHTHPEWRMKRNTAEYFTARLGAEFVSAWAAAWTNGRGKNEFS